MDSLGMSQLRFDGGSLLLPDTPGLGIDLNPEIVARYREPGDRPVRKGNYADLVFGRQYLPRTP